MPTLTIVTGVLLIALGLVGYIGTGSEHLTALIPTWFGIALAIAGFLARPAERRKLFMHIAVTLGLLGFLGTVTGLIKAVRMAAGQTVARPEAVEAQAVMCVLTGVFVAICVNSFIKARRAR